MKYFSVFLISVLMLSSCSSDGGNIDDNGDFLRSRVKVFSSCSEIEVIVTEILYNNRFINEDESKVTNNPYFFKCRWEQENTYDPNDFFILRQTDVFYHVDLLMDLTPEEILAQVNSVKVTDPRLANTVYNNILITKGFDSLLKANTYTLFVWKNGGRIDQVIIRDTNVAENVPDILEDSSVTDIFMAMLEPVG